MDLKNRIKIIQRALARWGLYGSYWLLSRSPYKAVASITRVFIAIGFRLTSRQRRLAKESLKIAFGDTKNEKEIDDIVRQNFFNLGQGMVEMLYFLSHPELVKHRVVFYGREHLDQALKEGKGIIAVTAHFGNFPLMMLSCTQSGYPTNVIVRPARDSKLEQFLFNSRTKAGLNTIYAAPRKQCVENTLKALRNNEIVFIPMDQNFGGDGGIFVDFFGQKAATATGPVVFAQRTKASIIPMFIIREHEDYHKIFIEPPVVLEERENEKEAIVLNVSKITQIIEQYVRRYPHEWGWMHRRWKSRPQETEPVSTSV